MSSKALSNIIYHYPYLGIEDKLFLLESISIDFMYNKKNSEYKKNFIKILKRKIEINKTHNRFNKLYNI